MSTVDMRRLIGASYKVSLEADKMVSAYGELPEEPNPARWVQRDSPPNSVEFTDATRGITVRCAKVDHPIEWVPRFGEGGTLLLEPLWGGRGDAYRTEHGIIYPHDPIDLGSIPETVRFEGTWKMREEVLDELERRRYQTEQGIQEKQKELREIDKLIKQIRS